MKKFLCPMIVLFCSFLIHSQIFAEIVSIQADFETPPVFDKEGFDADDPAIWVHPKNKSSSLILGTLKEGGMDVYNLRGEKIQHIPPTFPQGFYARSGLNPPRYNNVDLIYGFYRPQGKTDIAVVSDRGTDQIRVFAIKKDYEEISGLPLQEITAPNQPLIFSKDIGEVQEKKTAYGLATARPFNHGPVFTFVSRNNSTAIAQLILYPTASGQVAYRKINTYQLPDQFLLPNQKDWMPCTEEDGDKPHIEGMVFDQQTGHLFLGQEDIGIWKINIWKHTGTPQLIDKVRSFGVPYTRIWDDTEEEYICDYLDDQDPGYGGPYLHSDVEGLTIYEGGKDQSYLLASSQGNSTFVVYPLNKLTTPAGIFRVFDPNQPDKNVEHCDGAMVTHKNLGGPFDKGMMVVQDGRDDFSNEEDRTNFKIISWDKISKALNLRDH